MEAGVAIWQRLGLGLVQAVGTFDAQNLLGLISHFAVFPAFALFLRGSSGWIPAVVVLAGIAIEVLTTSRATIGLAGLGFAVLFVLSAIRQLSSRKMLVALSAIGAITILAPLVLSSLRERESVNSETASDYARAAMERAAWFVILDHPLGSRTKSIHCNC